MIKLHQISKSYGKARILTGISIAVQPGEFMTFLGPSGSGKTTCLRIISGFEHPDEGCIFLGDRDITSDPPFQRDVNQIFQSYALFPHLNVFENIAFGLKVKKLPANEIRRKVSRTIETVALGGTESRYPSQLSGGERQRVAVARAIICEPKVLLLDEPLSALDIKLQEQMKTELKALQKRLGITFIYVTHDQDHALTMSDRIAVINEGRIEQIGTPIDLYNRPATRFVASFIGETNLLEADVLDVNKSVTFRLEGGLLLETTRPNCNLGNSATISLRPEKLRLSRAKPAHQNSFRCRVQETAFRGALQIVDVSTAGAIRLRTFQGMEAKERLPFEPGDDLFCSIDAEDITLIEDQ